MTAHHVKGQGLARRAWQSLKIFGVVGLAAVSLAAANPAHSAPAIGAPNANVASVGRYDTLELTFPVRTEAVSPFLPYDPAVPSYAANLRTTEDARYGVSVDALLLPPGQTVWSKAQTWPCYWQEDFNAAGVATGSAEWHLRFAPTQLGTWHYELRATDASGSVTTAPAAFTCVASASKGFVHVSRTDSRYFEYDDGTPFIACGSNGATDTMYPIMAGIHAGGGTGLIRVWINAMGLIGGYNNCGEHLNGYGGSVVFSDAHSGRYSLSMPWNMSFGPQLSFATVANTTYTLTGYVKAAAGSAGLVHMWTSAKQPVGGECLPQPVGSPDSRGWQEVRATFTSGSSTNYVLGLGVYGLSSGAMLLDDVTITGPNGGDALGGAGGFESHTNYDQAAAAKIDTMVQTAQAEGQFLKMACVNKLDQYFGSIQNNGASTSNWFGAHQALGNSTNPNADTPVQRLQRYYARYLVARWGAYPAVHSFEYTNEVDDYDGVEYAGAQAFSHSVHSFTRDGSAQGEILCTCSTALNNAGLTYDPNFYENPATYPDIDYADYHFYPDSTDRSRGPGLPYDDVGNLYNCRGSVRVTSGGPNNLGKLRFTLAGQSAGDPNNEAALWPLPTLRGQGTWHLTYWLRKDAGALTVSAPQAQIHANFLPGGYMMSPVSGYTSPTTNWQQYSGTFVINDTAPHPGAWLNLYASVAPKTPAGAGVEFADVQLVAPDGLPFFRIMFNEPRMDEDTSAQSVYLAGEKQSFSGDPAIGKPFVVGETEVDDPAFNAMGAAGAAAFARQSFWGGDLSPYAQITQFWHEDAAAITASGGWKYEGAVERFLQGVPLSNGHFRDLGAVVSPTLRVVGQKDTQTGSAVLWVQNLGPTGDGSDAANWFNLTTASALMAPVTGTVTIPGLPAGSYEADVWNTSTGQFVDSLFLSTSAAGLSVPVSGLGADAAVKVFPAAAAHLALHLTASPTVVTSGSPVTFTLAYVNQGTSPALGVSLPWPVPAGTRFVSASSGGAYDAAQDTVTWTLGTVPAGASGSVTLKVIAL